MTIDSFSQFSRERVEILFEPPPKRSNRGMPSDRKSLDLISPPSSVDNMESDKMQTESRGFMPRMSALGLPRQIAFVVAIITAFISLIELLIGVSDAYDRFVKLMAVIMSTEIVVVFMLEIAGLCPRSWRRRLKFLVTVLSGHIVLFSLAGSLLAEGPGEILLLALGAIIMVSNALDRTESTSDLSRKPPSKSVNRQK